jgi:hypothetical protein
MTNDEWADGSTATIMLSVAFQRALESFSRPPVFVIFLY